MRMLQKQFRTGYTVDREDLIQIPTPPPTDTHQPVPHHEILREVEDLIAEIDSLTITKEQHVLSKVNKRDSADVKMAQRYLGMLELEDGKHREYAPQLHIINSHDKSMRASLELHVEMLICKNGMRSFAPLEYAFRKHTKFIEHDQIGYYNRFASVINSIPETLAYTTEYFDRLKLIDVSQKDVDHLVLECVRQKAFSTRFVMPILKEHKQPSYEPFVLLHDTAFCLLMAITHCLKKSNPFTVGNSTKKVHEVFNSVLNLEFDM